MSVNITRQMAKLNLKNAELNLHNAPFRENYKDNSHKLTLMLFSSYITLNLREYKSDRSYNLSKHLKIKVTERPHRLSTETLKTF